MLEIVYRTLPVVLVFLTDALYAWVWGGTHVEPLLNWMPWISLLAFQVLFFYPQRHSWEDAVAARGRVWKSLAHDPLSWCALAFLALLLIPLVNRGLCPTCDYAAIRAGASARPPMPYLPRCVHVGEHARAIMWFLPMMIATLAVRHSLVRRGKRAFLEMLAWNGVLLAVYGFILQGTGAKGPYGHEVVSKIWHNYVHFFSTFSYPNMAGGYFVLMCAISIGVWRQRWMEAGEIAVATAKDAKRSRYLWIRGNYPLVAAVLNFFGALCTLSRAAMIGVFLLAFITFIYIFAGIFVNKRKERIRSVKGAAWAALGLLVFLTLVYVFAPDGMTREFGTLSTHGVLDRMSGKESNQPRIAMAIFKDYPFFGVGCWGYRHFASSYKTKEELLSKVKVEGSANVHNDYLQSLCEFGVVGTGLLVAMLIMLLVPVFRDWRQVSDLSKFTPNRGDTSTAATVVYSMPPPIFWTMIGIAMVLMQACGDCPLRSSAVASAIFTSLAAMEGFIPNRTKGKAEDADAAGGESAAEERHRHHHHHHHHHHSS